MIVMPPCFNAGDTIYFYFDTYDSNGASVTMTGLLASDIECYKSGSTTQRTSDNGITLLDTDGIDFDGTTGLHGFSIDTSDNTDAGFWADGNQYLINVNAVTIDSQTVRFSYLLPLGYLLRPTTAGRKLDVSSGGEAGVDWANVGSPTTTQNLSGTTVKTATDVEDDTQDIQDRLPAALTANGNLKASFVELITTALTEGATGRLKAALTTLLDVVSPVFTAESVNLTSARAGYLDNLNIGGNVASSAEATAIQNNTRVVRVVPDNIELPASSTRDYRIELLLYDETGNMEAPDSAPTIALVNQSGTDRSSRLDSTTMTLVSTGRYRAVYTSTAGDTKEQLVWSFSVVEGGNTRLYGNTSAITDALATDFTTADRTKLEAIHTKLPSKSYLTGTANSDGDVQLDESTGDFNGTQKTSLLTEAVSALNTYDPPTRAEATSDKNEILTAVADVPTNAELATALGTADDAVLAALGNGTVVLHSDYNAAKTAASQSSVDDLPTNAELATALGTADDATLAAIATAQGVLDKLDDTLEDQGEGTWGFTEEALQEAPSSGGSGLTAQETADALKLAPTAGAPANTSVYDRLNDIEDAIEAISVGTGDGSVAVDHNYGGTDALRIVDGSGAGIDDVTIRAYLTSDWDANNRSTDFIVARTSTNANGRWAQTLQLDPGSYTLSIYKQGVYESTTQSLTVT